MAEVPAETSPLRFPLLSQWWVLVVRGAFAILFGLLALAWPGLTLIVLIAMFAGFCLADGITALVGAFRLKSWGWPVVGGILSILLGVLTFLQPATAGFVLVLLIGAWAIVRGVFDIATAIALRKEINYEWLLAIAGAISILFGLFVVVSPPLGALAIVGLIAGFAVFVGMVLIAAGLRARRLRTDLTHAQPAH